MILRAVMKGTQEIEDMTNAGPPRSYTSGAAPLKALMAELGKHKSVRYIQVQRGADRLVLHNAVGH